MKRAAFREFRSWHRENWSPALARGLALLPVTALLLCLIGVLGWPFDAGSRLYIPSFLWEKQTVREVFSSASYVPSTHNALIWLHTSSGMKYRWDDGNELMDELQPGDELTISYNVRHPFEEHPIVRALSVNGQERLRWVDAARAEDTAALLYIGFAVGAALVSALWYYAVMWRRYLHREQPCIE